MGELKLWSHNANYCLIEVVTKAGNLQDITEILLKVGLNTITLTLKQVWLINMEN
jgi:hypothetical protein